MKLSVYVCKIIRKNGKVLVTAVNGGATGPPKLVFEIDSQKSAEYHIGQKLTLTIEEGN